MRSDPNRIDAWFWPWMALVAVELEVYKKLLIVYGGVANDRVISVVVEFCTLIFAKKKWKLAMLQNIHFLGGGTEVRVSFSFD